MAQDPDDDHQTDEAGGLNPSHAFDMVSLYSSSTFDSEIEADVIRGILDSNGIPSLKVQVTAIPSLGFDVQVPREFAEDARKAIADAQAAGPDAAAEAERETES